MNVDKAFVDAADKILKSKHYQNTQMASAKLVVQNSNAQNSNKPRLSTTPLRAQGLPTSRLQVNFQPPIPDMGESSDGSSNTPQAVQRKPNRHRRKSAKTSLFGRGSKTEK